MHINAIENSLLQATVNPFLKRIISLIYKKCPRDGSLLLNSLKDFLGEPVSLCPTCKSVSTKMAKHFYRLGSSFLHADMDFMRNQFLNDEFGETWLRGFGLMMKGVEKYGVRIPFTPAGARARNMLKDSFEEIWDTHPLLWKLRIREDLEDCLIGGEKVGCGECPDKYICGGCRARAYSYFNGNVKMPDVGRIHNEPLWEKISSSRR